MVEYVIELDSRFGEHSTERFSRLYYKKIVRCAQFHSQPLALGDFVPCVDGVPMEDPRECDYKTEEGTIIDDYYHDCEQFQQAQSRVLFEGFEMTVNIHGEWYVEGYGGCIYSHSNLTIEDIAKLKPTLTETALKQLR